MASWALKRVRPLLVCVCVCVCVCVNAVRTRYMAHPLAPADLDTCTGSADQAVFTPQSDFYRSGGSPKTPFETLICAAARTAA